MLPVFYSVKIRKEIRAMDKKKVELVLSVEERKAKVSLSTALRKAGGSIVKSVDAALVGPYGALVARVLTSDGHKPSGAQTRELRRDFVESNCSEYWSVLAAYHRVNSKFIAFADMRKAYVAGELSNGERKAGSGRKARTVNGSDDKATGNSGKVAGIDSRALSAAVLAASRVHPAIRADLMAFLHVAADNRIQACETYDHAVVAIKAYVEHAK